MRTANTLIRLGGCPGWSESSLGSQPHCWFCHEAAQLLVTAERHNYRQLDRRQWHWSEVPTAYNLRVQLPKRSPHSLFSLVVQREWWMEKFHLGGKVPSSQKYNQIGTANNFLILVYVLNFIYFLNLTFSWKVFWFRCFIGAWLIHDVTDPLILLLKNVIKYILLLWDS